MKDIKLSPGFLIVKPVEAADQTKSGIIIPSTSKIRPSVATVEHLGPGHKVPMYRRQYNAAPIRPNTEVPPVSKGDKILYKKYAGIDFKYNNTDYLIIDYKDIIAVLPADYEISVGDD